MIASRLTINPLSSSNASVNLTVSAGGVHISTIYNSSVGGVSIVDLLQNLTTILTATYVPTEGPTVFGLDSLVITVPENV